MTAPDKAESALHRSGYVMDTGAAFPPDLRPWARDLGQGQDDAIILPHLLSCQLCSAAGRRKVVPAS